MNFGSDWLRDFMNDGIVGLALAAWEFLRSSFEAGAVTAEWWAVLVGGTIIVDVDGAQTVIDHPGMLNVVVIAMIPLLVIFVAIQVLWSLFRSSVEGVVRAFLVALVSVPTVYITTGIGWMLMIATDQMTQWILEIGGDDETSAAGGILALFGLFYDPSSGEIIMDENFMLWEMAANRGEPGQIIVPLIAMAIIFVVGLILQLMMIFRLVAILILLTFGPVAIYSLALEPAKAVATRWVSVIVALLIAKPVAAIIVKFGLVASAIGNDWTQLAAGIVLVLIAAAMPIVMLTFIAFATGGASDPMERAAAGMGRSAARQGNRAVAGSARRATSMTRAAIKR